jgi:hypothetical protein
MATPAGRLTEPRDFPLKSPRAPIGLIKVMKAGEYGWNFALAACRPTPMRALPLQTACAP